MKHLQDCVLYNEDIDNILGKDIPFQSLYNSSIVISGASGLVGTLFVDVLMRLNRNHGANIKIFALCRNASRATEIFAIYKDEPLLKIVSHDINTSLDALLTDECIDYVIHMASNTHPLDYATKPIETIMSNVWGTKNMLDFAVTHQAKRFLFTSSNEIYGENRGDVELFDEKYCGYIDCNSLRAGYPEGKRCGEAMCQAYRSQKKLDVVIARLTRSYGATLKTDDSKAMSQFIKKALNGENIVLKSNGEQKYSYTYVADAVSGLFYVLLKGQDGEAYNVADGQADKTLKEIAEILANFSQTKVVYELPSYSEQQGFSKVMQARLAGEKIKSLGWSLQYNIENGLKRTLLELREIRGC